MLQPMNMDDVQLVFPDLSSIIRFLLIERISGTEVLSRECTITGDFTDDQIFQACSKYGAQVVFSYVPIQEDSGEFWMTI
ncbi:hypothetical protein SAMN05444008_102400 [Cnuella takakiae]|uniref:Uncharacterized protein n=1 Tax=Cnuella takakiae TaxID=1302690 RepID=A0A1M4VVN2_9BACT|nr:hypothetical protein BUE76_11735 [Cnuella takakiae]SHE73046.1 hypothetical protein SAMN05444008_102400 [Cnuella takakiae]